MYAIYLRKSRADLDAEARGEGDTLSRHRKTLLDLAKLRGYTIGEIYEEIVSGDTIAARPEMQRLLSAVEKRTYEGVLVMDIDRLGRGDSTDQGMIQKTFKYSNTLIITVYKVFDPTNEMDEEFFEYNQYTARSEYKRIKRRMWAGRCAAAKEGKYQSPKNPLGYERVKLSGQRGWTLEPIPAEAEIVKMIFELYAYGENGEKTGKNKIATKLNSMGFRTGSGAKFTPSAVWSILSNPLYAGYIRWGKRLKHIEVVNGATVESRQRSDEPIIAKGIHPAIISQELFDAVQARLKSNPRLVSDNRKHVNPLAGLMYCSKCGNVMILSPDIHRNRFFYKCLTQDCPTSGIIADYVFEALINTLHSWLNNICLAPVNSETATDNRNEQKKSAYNIQLRRVAEQRNKICDLLEQGVYSTETYLARNAELEQREADIKNELAALDSQPAPPEERIRGLTDEIKHVLDVWERTTSAEEQSALLRTVISKIIYIKTERGYRNSDLSKLLTLQVFPAL